MKQHKWHKEIKAWAEGKKIEAKWLSDENEEWQYVETPIWDATHWKYRIKPQPKEPQYLYVYLADEGYHLSRLNPKESKHMEREQVVCIGKIKLEDIENE